VKPAFTYDGHYIVYRTIRPQAHNSFLDFSPDSRRDPDPDAKESQISDFKLPSTLTLPIITRRNRTSQLGDEAEDVQMLTGPT